jgi:hypothetical protein
MQYWSSILNILRKTVGAEVIVTAVPGTGSITSRAEQLNRFLQIKAVGRGINFMAHSMGGLDCRHLISRIKPEDYTPLSLTTVATPHRGSPFMDWCQARSMYYYQRSPIAQTPPMRSGVPWFRSPASRRRRTNLASSYHRQVSGYDGCSTRGTELCKWRILSVLAIARVLDFFLAIVVYYFFAGDVRLASIRQLDDDLPNRNLQPAYTR